MTDTAPALEDAVGAVLPGALDLSHRVHANPELGHQEYQASKRLADILGTAGANVEMGTAGMETAFKAVLPGSSDGPTIAVLAEYDALPKLGHGCGHNLIATSALGAGLALGEVLGELPGSVWVLGTQYPSR